MSARDVWILIAAFLVASGVTAIGEYLSVKPEKAFWQSRCFRFSASACEHNASPRLPDDGGPPPTRGSASPKFFVPPQINPTSTKNPAPKPAQSREQKMEYDFLCGFGNLLGAGSGIFWFVVLLPQILHNYARKSVDGLSFTWCWMNLIAGVLNSCNIFRLVFFEKIELTVNSKLCAVYFPLCNGALLAQFVLFPKAVSCGVAAVFWSVLAVSLLLVGTTVAGLGGSWGGVLSSEVSTAGGASFEWSSEEESSSPTLQRHLATAIQFAFYGAIFLWSYELIPQIAKNQRRGNCDGQARSSIYIVFFGKLCDFLYQMCLDLPLEYQFLAYFSSLTAFVNVTQWAKFELDRAGELGGSRLCEARGQHGADGEIVDAADEDSGSVVVLDVARLEKETDEENSNVDSADGRVLPSGNSGQALRPAALAQEQQDCRPLLHDHRRSSREEHGLSPNKGDLPEVGGENIDAGKRTRTSASQNPAADTRLFLTVQFAVACLACAFVVLGLPMKMEFNRRWLENHPPDSFTPLVLSLLAGPLVASAIFLTWRFVPEEIL